MLERDYYAPVAKWAKRALGCFATGIDTGLHHGRIDVLGLRDAGGRLSGRAEVIAIEVKRGTQPYATSVGQASGYSIYADRCYLAEYRPRGFSDDELAIAARLQVGLIQISGTKRVIFKEVLTAPIHEPLEGLRLEIIEKLHFSLCTICGSLFRRGEPGSTNKYVVREQDRRRHVAKAVADESGLLYWLQEQAWRSRNPRDAGEAMYHRRYVCPDCVAALLGHTVPET